MSNIIDFPIVNSFTEVLRRIRAAADAKDSIELDATAAESVKFLLEEAFPVLQSLEIAVTNQVSLALSAEDTKQLREIIDRLGERIEETAQRLDREMST